MATAGVGVFATGVGALALAHLTRRMGAERKYAGATILAYFVTDRRGEVILTPSVYPPEALRYHVRLRLPDGSSDEFECSAALFRQLREGEQGLAVCKGNALRAFYRV